MKHRIGFASIGIALACAACGSDSKGGERPDGGGADADVVVAVDAAPTADAPVSTARLDEFTTTVAGAVCDALYRCCDDDLAVYFGAFMANDLLEAYHDRLPPNAALAAADCPALVAEMMDIVPFGDWVREAVAGRVAFDEAAFDGCLADLGDAACGAPMRAALFDSECFAVGAPVGPAQRVYFARDSTVGDACAPIRDGVGAGFYGTCNPNAQFCCYQSATDPELGCTYPFTGEGELRPGVCQAVAATGAACGFSPPLKLCATGSDCDFDTGVCVEASEALLAVGDTCAEGFNLLGDCVDSWCDLFDSKRCKPPKANGDECSAGFECASGSCQESVCAPATLCEAR